MMRHPLPVLSVALALALFAFTPGQAGAAPAEDINQALSANGSRDAKHASKESFLEAYSAVLHKTSNEQLPTDISAAIRLRPDLAGPITDATLNAWAARGHGDGGKEILTDKELPCGDIDRIIRAAILADPRAAPAIVHAAVLAAPYAHQCIVAAAIAVAPDQRVAIERAAESVEPEALEGPGGIALVGLGGLGSLGGGPNGTINPGNIGGSGGTGGVVSPNQP